MKIKVEFEIDINDEFVDKVLEHSTKEQIMDIGTSYVIDRIYNNFYVSGMQSVENINVREVKENIYAFI